MQSVSVGNGWGLDLGQSGLHRVCLHQGSAGEAEGLSLLCLQVSLEWAGDGRTLLYTTPNQLGRPWRSVGRGGLQHGRAKLLLERFTSSRFETNVECLPIHEQSAPSTALAAAPLRRVLRCAANAADSVCSSSSPQLVFEEPDERYFVELSRTKDWAFLAINANSKTSSEARLCSAVGLRDVFGAEFL